MRRCGCDRPRLADTARDLEIITAIDRSDPDLLFSGLKAANARETQYAQQQLCHDGFVTAIKRVGFGGDPT